MRVRMRAKRFRSSHWNQSARLPQERLPRSTKVSTLIAERERSKAKYREVSRDSKFSECSAECSVSFLNLLLPRDSPRIDTQDVDTRDASSSRARPRASLRISLRWTLIASLQRYSFRELTHEWGFIRILVARYVAHATYSSGDFYFSTSRDTRPFSLRCFSDLYPTFLIFGWN